MHSLVPKGCFGRQAGHHEPLAAMAQAQNSVRIFEQCS